MKSVDIFLYPFLYFLYFYQFVLGFVLILYLFYIDLFKKKLKMFACSFMFFVLQLIFCTAWDVEDGEVFNNSLATNTTGMPELNNTYQMEGNDGMVGGENMMGTFNLENISTTGKPANSTSDDVCPFVGCVVFFTVVGFIVVILAFAVLSAAICLYAKRKAPSVLPQNVNN
uniref:Uncharacterized protein n=1 Tax=Meloidogyne enterolobii TaxID=390850 RepID=A0A6V7U4V3_MELEN|nr:unnamed protein product [Meloidogyne enterolobii]